MPGARPGAAFCELTTEMPGPLPAPDGAAARLTRGLAPGPARASGCHAQSRPGLGVAGGPAGSRSFAVPRLARLSRTALSGLRTPVMRPLPGRKTGKAGTGWPTATVSGGGRRRGAGSPALPAVVPTAGGTRVRAGARDGAPQADPQVPGPRYPAGPDQSSHCRGQGPPLLVAALAGTTTGSAADPHTTANLSHPPRPAACRNPPFGFSPQSWRR
jgi:hypothetical protein